MRKLLLTGTKYANATWGTLRRMLMSIGAKVTVSRRRIHFALSSGCPYQDLYFEVVDRLKAMEPDSAPPAAAS